MGLFDNYSDVQKFGMTAGAGGIGAGLAGMFMDGGKNPYDAGKNYYDKIPGTIKPYFDPYINAGHNAMDVTQGQYGSLINDPSGMFNKFANGYQKSPGFDWQMNQGMNAANNAAAAGGMAGSPQHQQQAATMAEGLANQDFYNYMSHVLGLYGTGLQGEQGISTTGYQASDQLAGGLANSLMNQGNTAFAGQAAQNKSQGDMWGNLFGGAATLAAFL